MELGHSSRGIPLVPQDRCLLAEPHGAVVVDVDVVDDAHPVTEPVGTAERDRLVNRRQPERLAGVNREARVVVSHVFERVQVPGRRIAGLRAGDVETDDALVPEPDRQLGDLAGQRGVAHRGDQAADGDRTAGRSGGLLAIGESGQHGVHDLVERQPAVDVQLGANRTSA